MRLRRLKVTPEEEQSRLYSMPRIGQGGADLRGRRLGPAERHLPGGLQVGQRSARARVVGHHRLAIARSLRYAHTARDDRAKHQVTEVTANLVTHLRTQPGSPFEHGEQDRADW